MTRSDLYAFAFRGILTEQALERAGRKVIPNSDEDAIREVRAAVPLDDFTDDVLAPAVRMAVVYTAIAAFENTARSFVSDVLSEAVGESWWTARVSKGLQEKAHDRMEKESKVRYHTPRGGRPVDYLDFGDLGNIIANNWTEFKDYLPSAEWAKQIFDLLENSRNIVMHSGHLDMVDVERVGMNIRDWIRQVGV